MSTFPNDVPSSGNPSDQLKDEEKTSSVKSNPYLRLINFEGKNLKESQLIMQTFWRRINHEMSELHKNSDYLLQEIPVKTSSTIIQAEAENNGFTPDKMKIDISAACVLSKLMEIFVLEMTTKAFTMQIDKSNIRLTVRLGFLHF